MKGKHMRIGIIGTGVGLRTHLPAFQRLDGVEVVALAGSSGVRAKQFAERAKIGRWVEDFRELCAMPDVDLVCVTSPNPFHREQVLDALAHGKHVLCEKPLAMSVAEARDLTAAARTRSDCLTLLNHQLRFNPYIQRVRSLLADGAIGQPYFVRVHQQSTGFSDRSAVWNWSFDRTMGGGVRIAMGSHLLDLLTFWFGRRVVSVYGAVDVVVPDRVGPAGEPRKADADAFFSASVALEGGIDAQLSATAASCGMAQFDFSVYGDAGELHFDLAGKLVGAFLSSRGKVEAIPVAGVTDEERSNKVSIFSGSFVYFAPRIREAIETGDMGAVREAARFEDGLVVHQVLDAIEESARSGDRVRLDQSGATPSAPAK